MVEQEVYNQEVTTSLIFFAFPQAIMSISSMSITLKNCAMTTTPLVPIHAQYFALASYLNRLYSFGQKQSRGIF